MKLDARGLAEGTILETDVCIVGAGPAGLALASELARGAGNTTPDVMLLESGGDTEEASIADLNDGDVSGDEYAGLRQSRSRQIGGTTALWNTPTGQAQLATGAKYVPLDPVDLEERAAVAHSGWPITYAELQSYYECAQRLCGLGRFAYDADRWTRPGREPLSTGPLIESRVYHVGSRDAFLLPILSAISRSNRVRLYSHATVLRLEAKASGRQVTSATVSTPGGARWRVRAKRFVLAAGAVENARLLLLPGDQTSAFGNQSGWVGRCFMEHPRDRALVLVPRSRNAFVRRAAFYDLDVDDYPVIGRLAVAEDPVRRGVLPNASATLLARVHPAIRRARTIAGPLGRWLPGDGHGWSRRPSLGRLFGSFTVLLNVEQRPHPENRVILGRRRDSLGLPVPELHWRWRSEDHSLLERLRTAVAAELEATGLGTVHTDLAAHPDPNAHHHAGTTRMHADPRFGVVDSDCRVHGTENVYVAGASTFPTAGFANPTLTIVGMAIRLADHIRSAI